MATNSTCKRKQPPQSMTVPPKRMKREEIPYPFVSLFLPHSVGEICDVTVIVQGERFDVHESIITAASPVFQVMLTNGMKESVSKEVFLKNMKKSTWKLVMNFMYTGEIKVGDNQTAIQVIEFAHQYEMDLLLHKAELQATNFVCADNAIELLLFADKLGLQILRQGCTKAIHRHLITIRDADAFKNLPFRLIDEILERKDQAVCMPMVVFEAINRWSHSTSLKNQGASGSPSPWKLAQAQYLLRHLDSSKMDMGNVRALAKHPSIKYYPDLIPSLLNTIPEKSDHLHLIARGFTFYLTIQLGDLHPGIWNDTPWYSKDVNSKKWRLRLWKNTHHIQAVVAPFPNRLENVQIFRIGAGAGVVYPILHYTGVCSFAIPTQMPNPILTFGATIFS